MHATEATLLSNVIENHDDDAPRFVYADWLEDCGDSRGEFIRVQCALADIDPHNPRRTDLEARELQLVRQHSKGWAGPIRRLAKRWWFRRGFVEEVEMSAKQFLERHEDLFEYAPVRTLRLTGVLETFEYHSAIWKGIDNRIDELSACPHLSRIQSIIMDSSPDLGHLPDSCSSRFLLMFLSHFKSLELILLGDHYWWRWARWKREEIVNRTGLANLKVVDRDQEFDWRTAGISRFACNDDFSRSPKHSLNLRNRDIAEKGIPELVSRDTFLSVCLVSLSSMDLAQANARAIAESPNVANLTHLDINGARRSERGRILDEGLRALMESENLSRLASLGLRRNGITPIGIGCIVKSPIIEQLYWIDLSQNDIGDEGALLLAAHGPWKKLAYLNVRHNALSKSAKVTLRKRFGYRVLF